MNWIPIALCTAFLSAPSFAQQADQQPSQQVDPQEAAWQLGLGHKQAQDWLAAITAFEAYQKSYPGTARALMADLEIGVCCIGEARKQLQLRRVTPKALEYYTRANSLFDKVRSAEPNYGLAPRAQYLLGQIGLYLDDPARAYAAYDLGVRNYASDANYHAKCLERRAASSRALLDSEGALKDLQTFLQQYPKDKEVELARRMLRYTQLLGKPAPSFVADRWAFSDALQPQALLGQPVLIAFMASWCEKCAREKEYIQDLERRYAARGLRFIGIVHPWREVAAKNRHTEESFLSFAASSGFRFPLMQDSGTGEGTTTRGFGSESLPEIVLIDAEGKVRWHDHTSNLLDSTIERLLATAKPKEASK